MIADVDVSLIQEINYLHSFTSGEAQKLVDNFRKRKQHNHSALLISLWVELERPFGSVAAITKVLLKHMNETAVSARTTMLNCKNLATIVLMWRASSFICLASRA